MATKKQQQIKPDYQQKQKELDQKKYLQSQTARTDLSGLMAYCENCDFRKLDVENNRLICNLDTVSREVNQVCAKNYYRRKQK